MTDRSFPWYAPAPYESFVRRIALDFNLRSADRFFGERVVPGACRVWFVRELSWAVGALALMPELPANIQVMPSPADVAHGIEALASRLAYFAQPEGSRGFSQRRIFGQRAFGRDGEVGPWSFGELSRREHYVRNTHRIAITTALRDQALGLVSSRRFGSMRPVGLGRELGEAFLSQWVGTGEGSPLRRCLRDWIVREHQRSTAIRNRPHLVTAIGPETPSANECRVVRDILFKGNSPAHAACSALATTLRGYEELPSVERFLVPALLNQGKQAQALDLLAARAFGAMFDATVELAFAVHTPIHSERQSIAAAALAGEAAVRMAHDSLRAQAEVFRSAAAKAALSGQPDLYHALILVQDLKTQPLDYMLVQLLRLAPTVFDVQGGFIGRGPLFDRLLFRTTGATQAEADADADEIGNEDDIVPAVRIADEPTARTFGLDGFLSASKLQLLPERAQQLNQR